MAAKTDLIAAIATASGHGGIGVVRLSGAKDPILRLSSLLPSAISDKEIAPRKAIYTDFLDSDGSVIDQGLVIYFQAPYSFTGEHVLELHGHGGPTVMNMLLNRCTELGARLAEPGEFSLRAFLNGKLDLAQAEAISDLIYAESEAAARSASRSLTGTFSRIIERLNADLTSLRVLIEAVLDFPEEEVDPIQDIELGLRLRQIIDELDQVLGKAKQGNLLQNGMRVVLTGRPNVGKSTLLNCLADQDVAIVSSQPGTTRDIVQSRIQIEGVPVQIIDTAGLRESEDEVEKIGISRTWQALSDTDAALFVVDANQINVEDGALQAQIIEQLEQDVPIVTVVNKIDLLPQDSICLDNLKHQTKQLTLSAKTGEGVDKLRQELLRLAGWQPTEDTFIARKRHLDALLIARHHLINACQQIDQDVSYLELLAEELRLARQALGQITGEFTADELLGEIFSHFCIGK